MLHYTCRAQMLRKQRVGLLGTSTAHQLRVDAL